MKKDLFCDLEVIQKIDSENNSIKLKEDKNKNSKEILISKLPEDTFCIKLDIDKIGYKEKSKYFRTNTEFINKSCDYCLIIPSIKNIILIELKSDIIKEKDYINKFMSSELFLTYCNNISNYINNLDIKYKFKYILFSTKFNSIITTRDFINLEKENNKGEKIYIKATGFMDRIRFEKLIK